MGDNYIIEELNSLLESANCTSYVFRTRLERILIRVEHVAKSSSWIEIVNACQELKDKLNYVSDQSNQTPDGTLRSFLFLQPDIRSILTLYSENSVQKDCVNFARF